VVEMIGGGLSTRVLVTKGSLNLISQQTKGVVVYYVVNEKKEICIENTYLIYDDQVFKTDETGKIMIPMEKNSEKGIEVIIVNNNFASICKITIPRESYDLKLNSVFNEERLLPGTMCEFILRPKLFCTEKPISLAHLYNIKLEINCYNVNMVKSQEVFKDIVFTDDKDYVVKYLIPNKTKQISATLTAKLASVDKKEKSLSTYQECKIENYDKKKDHINFPYLRQVKGDNYIIKLLGKNGEDVPKKTGDC